MSKPPTHITLVSTMQHPNKDIEKAYLVLEPLWFKAIDTSVTNPSNAEKIMVTGEVWVVVDSSITPSPHNIAVDEYATIQKGHFGSIAMNNPVAIPHLPLAGLSSVAEQALHGISMAGRSLRIHKTNLFTECSSNSKKNTYDKKLSVYFLHKYSGTLHYFGCCDVWYYSQQIPIQTFSITIQPGIYPFLNGG